MMNQKERLAPRILFTDGRPKPSPIVLPPIISRARI